MVTNTGSRSNRRGFILMIFELPEFLIEESAEFRNWLVAFLLKILELSNGVKEKTIKLPRFFGNKIIILIKDITIIITQLLNWIEEHSNS
jgi:hypothetical protein